MHATKLAFILSSLAGMAAVHAAPTEATADINPVAVFQPEDGINFLYSEVVKGETLYWFGDDGKTSDTAAVAQRDDRLERRCGTNRPLNCDHQNVPKQATCSALLNLVQDSLQPTGSARAVCTGTTFDQCCISWSSAGSSLRRSALYLPAREVYIRCLSLGNSGSGKAWDVSLDGACSVLCLSNRATQC